MPTETIRPSGQTMAHPLHAMLVPVPVACFVGAWLTDIAYWRTMDAMWSNFSIWLLAAGLAVAGLAVLVAAIGYFVRPASRVQRAGMIRGVGTVVVLVLSLVNAFVHSRDGYTAVVPTGITLSTIAVAIVAILSVIGASAGNRRGVGA